MYYSSAIPVIFSLGQLMHLLKMISGRGGNENELSVLNLI